MTKKSFEKKHVKDIKIFMEKKRTKNTNMLVSDIKISLKKKNKRSINMVVSNERIFCKMSIENFFLKCRK